MSCGEVTYVLGHELVKMYLKREGKQDEALDALRRAKMYENKLNSLTP